MTKNEIIKLIEQDIKDKKVVINTTDDEELKTFYKGYITALCFTIQNLKR